VLTEDDVPLNACVSHVVGGFDVAADGCGRHCDTGCIVNDNCHSREETEKYVDTFPASNSRKVILFKFV